MKFTCPLCKKEVKRDMRKKPWKGKKLLKSFCDKHTKLVVLKPRTIGGTK